MHSLEVLLNVMAVDNLVMATSLSPVPQLEPAERLLEAESLVVLAANTLSPEFHVADPNCLRT